MVPRHRAKQQRGQNCRRFRCSIFSARVMYQPSLQALADGRRWEGYSLAVYPDSKGLPTQGIGRHHGINFGAPQITDETAARWFAEDWQDGYISACRLFPDLHNCDVVRLESLIWLVFNMGILTLSQFSPFITHVNAKRWASAQYHLLTNLHGHLTPYLLQVGARGVETGIRIGSGEILPEFKA